MVPRPDRPRYTAYMPAIDSGTDELILRIAYDGASRAGKTTNLRHLGQSLESQVHAPSQVGERTIYFDWMQYRSGSFEGRPIRCELLSAPGQELLAQRRDILLSTADAIVIVVDLSRLDLAKLRARIQNLRCTNATQTPPAILIQANKCDLASKAELEELQSMCKTHRPPLMFTSATAKEGKGVRETFVLAVRLAVIRARALRRQGLDFPSAETVDAETMLQWLRSQESLFQAHLAALPPKEREKLQAEHTPDETVNDIEETELSQDVDAGLAPSEAKPPPPFTNLTREGTPKARKTSSAEPDPSTSQEAMISQGEQGTAPVPEPPRPDVPEGMVWPPVTGRAALEDISAQSFQIEEVEAGGYFATVKDRWMLHTAADAVFHSPVEGMEQLLEWAKQHSQLSEVLSGPRCIVLSPADNQQGKSNPTWRLWQLVRVHRPVRDRIASLLDEEDALVIADSLISAGSCILQLESQRKAYPLLPECTLESVGERLSGAHYVGLLPGPKALASGHEQERPKPEVLLARELTEVVLQDWRENSTKIRKEIRLLAKEFEDPKKKLAAQTLTDILNKERLKTSPVRRWSRALRLR